MFAQGAKLDLDLGAPSLVSPAAKLAIRLPLRYRGLVTLAIGQNVGKHAGLALEPLLSKP